MTDKLTTEERVKLAEYAGKKWFMSATGQVLLAGLDGVFPHWQPAEDARQWGELVELMARRSLYLTIHLMPTGPRYHAHFRDHTNVAHRIVAEADEVTLGLAVCRAALKVIAERVAT